MSTTLSPARLTVSEDGGKPRIALGNYSHESYALKFSSSADDEIAVIGASDVKGGLANFFDQSGSLKKLCRR